MSVRIKIARTPEEMENLFRARHTIFVEEEKYFEPRPGGQIYDQFDTFPSTVNLIAQVGQEIVGGLRITEHSDAGTPSEHLFDFSHHMPKNAANIVSASMLCMKAKYRKVKRLTFMLLCMGVYWAISRKVSHVIAAINPLIEPMLKSVGFKRVQAPFFNEELGINILPAILNLKDVHPRFYEMSQFQGFHGTLRTFEREYYRKGEQIIKCGDEGHCAYVIIDGRVSVSIKGRRANDDSNIIISELDEGEIVGELSLLTNEPRAADVFAVTDVDLMVIDRDVFQEQLLGNPDLQSRLLEILGHRLRRACVPEQRSAVNM
jgi:N-acyl-L-homoserine lactone synthetase